MNNRLIYSFIFLLGLFASSPLYAGKLKANCMARWCNKSDFLRPFMLANSCKNEHLAYQLCDKKCTQIEETKGPATTADRKICKLYTHNKKCGAYSNAVASNAMGEEVEKALNKGLNNIRLKDQSELRKKIALLEKKPKAAPEVKDFQTQLGIVDTFTSYDAQQWHNYICSELKKAKPLKKK